MDDLRPVHQHQGGALAGGSQGYGATDALGRAGDDHDLTYEMPFWSSMSGHDALPSLGVNFS
jgi:hypothetical protein